MGEGGGEEARAFSRVLKRVEGAFEGVSEEEMGGGVGRHQQ